MPRSFMRISITAFLSALLPLSGCEDATTSDADTAPENRLDIVVFDYAFAAPTEIPSGWIELSVSNQRAEEIHEVTLVRLPDEIEFTTYLDEFIRPWERIWEQWLAGDVNRDNLGEITSELLPAWSGDLDYRHARGLLSPGRDAVNTIHLPPGRYALECWVKNPDGVIHISNGMIRELVVREEDGGGSPPSDGIGIRVDRDGIHMSETFGTGTRQFAVDMEVDEHGRPVHGDLHLIRLEEDTDLSRVVTWLDWYRIGGLQSPAPATFLGGFSTYGAPLHDGTAYFTLNIDRPGQYAWVIEDDPAQQPWQTFQVE